MTEVGAAPPRHRGAIFVIAVIVAGQCVMALDVESMPESAAPSIVAAEVVPAALLSKIVGIEDLMRDVSRVIENACHLRTMSVHGDRDAGKGSNASSRNVIEIVLSVQDIVKTGAFAASQSLETSKILHQHLDCSIVRDGTSAGKPDTYKTTGSSLSPQKLLYSNGYLPHLVLFFLGCWVLIHVLCHWIPSSVVFLPAASLLHSVSALAPASSNMQWREHWRYRSFARRQIYTMLALLVGLYSALDYLTDEDCMRLFTYRHQLIFAAGLSHSVMSVAESAYERPLPNRQLWAGQLYHVLAAVSFGLCLMTRRVSAGGICMLLVEAPSLLVGVRDALRWRRSLDVILPGRLEVLWDAALSTTLLTRLVPLVLYVASRFQRRALWARLPESGLWHVIALVFSLQSILWYCLLSECRCKDLEDLCTDYKELSENLSDTNDDVTTGSDVATPTDDLKYDAAVTLPEGATVSVDDLQQHCTPSSCWLAVAGDVCDVTSFLDLHPGGAARLLEYAGADATEAFNAVGHSQEAFRQLAYLKIARLENAASRPNLTTSAARATAAAVSLAADVEAAQEAVRSQQQPYDVMEEFRGHDRLAMLFVHPLGVLVCLFGLRSCPGDRTLESSLGSLALVAALSIPFGLLTRTNYDLRDNSNGSSNSGRQGAVLDRRPRVWLTYTCPISFLVLLLAFQNAPFRSLVLGAAGALFLELAWEDPPQASLWAGGASWIFLCSYLVPGAEVNAGLASIMGIIPGVQPSYNEFILGAAALAIALPTFCHGILRSLPQAGASLHPSVASDLTTSILRRAGVWAALFLTSLWLCDPHEFSNIDGGTVVASSRRVPVAQDAGVWVRCIGFTVFSLVMVHTMVDLIANTSCRAASTWITLIIATPPAVAAFGSISGCVGFWGWLLQLRHLARSLESSVRTPSAGTPAYWFALQYLTDSLRGYIALAIWYGVGKPLESVVSWMLPSGLRVIAFEQPLSDLDGRLTVGISLMLEGAQLEPGYVVCNVGHIPEARHGDVRATVKSSLEIMHELDDNAHGFVANVLCVLPERPKPRQHCWDCRWLSMRQINLSVWRSDQDAAAWYRRSRAHSQILAQHQDGSLKVFGNMLASLKPTHLRWQRRCRRCAAVAEGRDASECPRCGCETWPIPVF